MVSFSSTLWTLVVFVGVYLFLDWREQWFGDDDDDDDDGDGDGDGEGDDVI